MSSWRTYYASLWEQKAHVPYGSLCALGSDHALCLTMLKIQLWAKGINIIYVEMRIYY